MAERKIMIGTDPEYFMRNKETSALVSAIPYIKGGKHDPIPLKHGGNIQSDNVAVEFSIKPAHKTEDFIANLKATLADTIDVLPKGFELAVLPSAEFHPLELADPKAQEFGCTSDHCAWELIENDSPRHPNPNFRSCGGHIHVGCLDEDGVPIHPESQFLLEFQGKIAMIRGMDLFHGIISTILDSSPEAIERRKLYGKAGCHRATDYGVEYRTLSNYWTKSPMLSMLISSLTDDVVELIIKDQLNAIIEEVGAQDIQRIINEGDVADAKSTLEKVLISHLSEDSKFYLEECIAKIGNTDSIAKAWAIEQ